MAAVEPRSQMQKVLLGDEAKEAEAKYDSLPLSQGVEFALSDVVRALRAGAPSITAVDSSLTGTGKGVKPDGFFHDRSHAVREKHYKTHSSSFASKALLLDQDLKDLGLKSAPSTVSASISAVKSTETFMRLALQALSYAGMFGSALKERFRSIADEESMRLLSSMDRAHRDVIMLNSMALANVTLIRRYSVLASHTGLEDKYKQTLRTAPLLGPNLFSDFGAKVLKAKRKDPTLPNIQISLPSGAKVTKVQGGELQVTKSNLGKRPFEKSQYRASQKKRKVGATNVVPKTTSPKVSTQTRGRGRGRGWNRGRGNQQQHS